MTSTNIGDMCVWSRGSAERHMSEDDRPMLRCLAGGCTEGPFAGHNTTKTRFHAAQVKGGGIKVCNGMLDEQLFGTLGTDLTPAQREEGEDGPPRAAEKARGGDAHRRRRGRRRAERVALIGLVSHRCCDNYRRLSRRRCV